MRIGILYDLLDDYVWQEGDPPDANAEYEPVETVDAISEAIKKIGHEPVRIGSAQNLLKQLDSDSLGIDAAINIAESYGSRNREAHVPILLELAGVPCLGSDAMTMSISLDKQLTRELAEMVDVAVPAGGIYKSTNEITPENLPAPFPLFVKPRYEGTAKGITAKSKVSSIDELRNRVAYLISLYKQDVLVEEFAAGAEFTVAIFGNNPSKVMPVLERALEKETGIGLHALESGSDDDFEWKLTHDLPPALEKKLQQNALAVYNKLECLDFARLDFKLNAAGEPLFLEINPLPTFAPDGTFAILAELMGKSYEDFLAEILSQSLDRMLFNQ